MQTFVSKFQESKLITDGSRRWDLRCEQEMLMLHLEEHITSPKKMKHFRKKVIEMMQECLFMFSVQRSLGTFL